MPHQSVVGNRDETSGDQCAYDGQCVLRVVAALYSTEKYTDQKSSYPHYTTVLNLANIEFPITLKDISKFE